uniref:Phosphoinositide-interacting protein n=1 Tax=Esox lucius TaxID=8010 RepID=A0A3P8Z907_ESOLU
MKPTVFAVSDMDRRTSQISTDHETQETEASSPLNPVPEGVTLGTNLPCWYYFARPLLAILIGGVLFSSGTALSLLYFTQVGNVPYLLGPVFLSVGLMFLVTGLVWVPVVKQRLEHKALTKINEFIFNFCS